MLRLEWNALRPGDHVAVHDDTDAAFTLADGTVVLVQAAARSNEIAVRVTRPGGQPKVVRPRRLAVHGLPIDRSESCWRCESAEARQPTAGSTERGTS